MDECTENYQVYVKLDAERNIIAVNSSAFLEDTTDWFAVDEGSGDKYHHAQGHYLEKGLFDEEGCCNYKLVEAILTERTLE